MRVVWLVPTRHTPAQFIHVTATRMRHHLLAALLVAAVSVVNVAQAEKYYSSDGVRIRFVEQGAGEPVVLIHGLLGSIDDWRRTTRVLDDLSRDHRVIALDLRGHGQSDKPRDPVAYGARLTEDVLRLLDHLKIERAHIVGYSFGGAVAGRLVVTNPERFASAILGGSSLRQRGTQQEIDAGERQAADFLTDPPMAATLRRTFPTLSDVELRDRSRQILGPSDPQSLAAFVRGGVSLAVTEADLERIRVPVLAIVGSNDPSLRGVNDLKTLLPSLTVRVIEGGVHIIAEERGTPRFPAFTEAIREFIKEHPASR